jgi:hypothetical protein
MYYSGYGLDLSNHSSSEYEPEIRPPKNNFFKGIMYRM